MQNPPIIDIRLIPIFLGMSEFCKHDLKSIDSEGWGYAGPFEAAEESVEVGVVTVYRTVSDEEYIDVKDLFQEKYWVHAPNAQVKSIQTRMKMGDQTISQCLGWIPSDFNALLEEATAMVLKWGVEGISWNLDVENDDCQILLKMSDGEEVIGSGETLLTASLDFYLACWELDYEMNIPSITTLTGDFIVYTRDDGESFIEFNDYQDTMQFLEDELLRYGSDMRTSPLDLYKDKSLREHDGNIGSFIFAEGDFNVVLLKKVARSEPDVENPF